MHPPIPVAADVFETSVALFSKPKYKNCSPPVVVVKLNVIVSQPFVFLVTVEEINCVVISEALLIILTSPLEL